MIIILQLVLFFPSSSFVALRAHREPSAIAAATALRVCRNSGSSDAEIVVVDVWSWRSVAPTPRLLVIAYSGEFISRFLSEEGKRNGSQGQFSQAAATSSTNSAMGFVESRRRTVSLVRFRR
jgi:hypothetical protein